jgi:phosphate transport system substrate-binding protein
MITQSARSLLLALLVVLTGAVGVRAQDAPPIALDAKLKPYAPTSGVSGALNSVGSDTLNNLMTLWAEGFQKQYPNVKIQIEGKGSSTAPPALISGTAQLGPMSRPMKAKELDDFEKKFGYKPTEIKVAVDALSVYVNKDNPIEKMTMTQVDAVFSKTRNLGVVEDIATWGQLGLTGAWASHPISLYGRNSASGTYGFFKDHALGGGDYKDSVKEQPGSASVVQGVTEDLYGIGYSGIGYRTSGVRPVSLSKDADSKAFGVSQDEVMSGEYPLSRFLYVYINKVPNQAPDPLIREFVNYVMSTEGQEVVVKDSYLPLTAKLAAGEIEKLGM